MVRSLTPSEEILLLQLYLVNIEDAYIDDKVALSSLLDKGLAKNINGRNRATRQGIDYVIAYLK